MGFSRDSTYKRRSDTVSADDRIIEKEDRGIAEPLQFYTGCDRLLYEVVIFTIEKNKVTGYLDTPKSAAPSIAKRWLRVPLYGHCPNAG